jgi:hypothetical protein
MINGRQKECLQTVYKETGSWRDHCEETVDTLS